MVKFSFAVPAGPAETFKERAREAADAALELAEPASSSFNLDAIEAAIERVAAEGPPEADAVTVTAEV